MRAYEHGEGLSRGRRAVWSSQVMGQDRLGRSPSSALTAPEIPGFLRAGASVCQSEKQGGKHCLWCRPSTWGPRNKPGQQGISGAFSAVSGPGQPFKSPSQTQGCKQGNSPHLHGGCCRMYQEAGRQGEISKQ